MHTAYMWKSSTDEEDVILFLGGGKAHNIFLPLQFRINLIRFSITSQTNKLLYKHKPCNHRVILPLYLVATFRLAHCSTHFL